MLLGDARGRLAEGGPTPRRTGRQRLETQAEEGSETCFGMFWERCWLVGRFLVVGDVDLLLKSFLGPKFNST